MRGSHICWFLLLTFIQAAWSKPKIRKGTTNGSEPAEKIQSKQGHHPPDTSSDSDEYPLTILHTNDVHSKFLNFNALGGVCTKQDLEKKQCWGGAARRMTAVRKYQKEDGPNVLLLDAGDQYQGTMWYTLLKWEPIAKYMNLMNYDAMAFGNHEFDDKFTGLVPYAKIFKKLLVNSNIKDNGSPIRRLFQSKIVVSKGGQKIGIVGCTTTTVPTENYLGPLIQFLPEISSLQTVVNELIKSGINKIIVLSHSGIWIDRQICQHVKGVDIVIGGHTHAFLWSDHNGPSPTKEWTLGPYPEKYDNNGGHPCVMATSGAFGKYLGRLKVKFDNQGVLKDWSNNNPILVDMSFQEDKTIASVLKPYREEMEEKQKKVVATTEVFLNGKAGTCRKKECNLGNILTDASVYYYAKHLEKSGHLQKPNNDDPNWWKGAAIGVWNSGGIRHFSLDAKHNLTLDHLYSIMPFSNMIDKITVKGKHLKEAFEHSVDDIEPDWPSGAYLQVSGVRVVFDVTKPKGHRLKSVEVLTKLGTDQKYIDIEDEQEYDVITSVYVIRMQFETLGEFGKTEKIVISQESNNWLDIDVVLDYLETHNKIMTVEEGRIKYDNGTGIFSDKPTFSEEIWAKVMKRRQGA